MILVRREEKLLPCSYEWDKVMNMTMILIFYNNRSSNALAESFNAKMKLFRVNLRGVIDKKFSYLE